MEKKRQTTFSALLGYRVFFAANIVILLMIGLSVGREFVRSAAIEREIADLQVRQSEWEDKKLSLEVYQEYLHTEAFLEKEAREKFGLQRPGEEQVFIDEDAAVDTLLAPEATSKPEDRPQEAISNIRMWSWYFFQPERYREEAHL